MQSLKHKNMHQQWFEEQIVQGKNLVRNPVQKKIQQNLQRKANKKYEQIPRYSSQKLKQIELQISNLKPVELSIMETNQYVQSIICLMCWIWQSQSFQYKLQKSQKRTKKIPQNQEEIDCSKSIRKLFQFYNKNHEIFNQTIFLGRDIIQKNGIKTKIAKDQQKKSKSSKAINQKDSCQTQNSQELLTVKNYIIYQVYKNFQKYKKNDEQISLITLLLQIIVLSYDWIVLLDINIASSAIIRFSFLNMKNNLKNESCLKQKIYQQLLLFTFSQLHYLKIGQVSNQQGINSINRKRGSQQILWKFLGNLIKIINFKMNQSTFIQFDLKSLQVLKTAHILVSQLTHYMKKIGTQIKQVKIKDLEQFFQIFVQKIVEVQFFLFSLKQKKDFDMNSFNQNGILKYNFQLFLFDWALLVIKNDQNKLFKKVMKICKKRLLKSIEQKNIDSKENLRSKYRSNQNYNQFVIKQDPNEFSEGKSINQEKQFFNRQSQDQVHLNSRIDHSKIKTFLSVPHMKLLTFKEHVPLSVKRRQDKKLQSKKQGQDDCLIYLLILYNRQYIMQLLQEIQFIQVQQLDPDIGKGLVKLCTYCNKFTSLILSERYFKLLSSKPHHHNLLQSVFDKDIDYQRRLSQSRLSYHSSNKSLPSSEFQSSQQNESRLIQKKQITQQQEILKVRLKSCESIFFEMITEIQSKISLLKISSYIDEALKKPQIFRAQVFYHKLFQYQHPSYGREYLSQLIIRWIDHELRFFNILTYFDIFFKNCLFSQSQEGQLSLLIEGLPISKLIKLHCLLLTQTFAQQTTLKVSPPQGISPFEKIQLLTSGGFQQKTRFIDKQFNGMSQIILWNKYLKLLSPLERSQKYVYIKSYFTLIFYSFSGNQNWNKSEQKIIFLIEKFKIDIQKDRVDEVCSIFHFLSLTLFPNKSLVSPSVMDSDRNNYESESLSFKTRTQQNARQKIIEQIFYLIRQNCRKIIDMYKNKESLTIKYLTQDIRRKTTNDINSDMDDMKRKQVTKMLNKQKLMHDYLIKIIVRFLQNVQYTESFLKNFHSPEQFINTSVQICKRDYLGHEQKIFQTEKVLNTPKLNYFLSSVSSDNQFQMNFKKELKKFQQNFEKHQNRYLFILMIRFIAQKWVQQKSQPVKTVPSQKNKSKNTKSSKSSIIDNSRSKQKNPSITSLISIQSIFKICFSLIQFRFESSAMVRQSEVLKQKMICLQTVCLLSNFIIENSVSLQSSNSSLLKSYHTNFHWKLSQILIKLLMNNEAILGKNERELILHIRLQALSHMIQNYAYNNSYDKYEWRLMKDRKSFWFLINCLVFDKSVELRFFIIKSILSRFSSSKEFGSAMSQKMLIMQLMVVQEPVKQLSQLARKTLNQTFQYSLTVNTSKGLDLMLNSLMGCVEFVVNFNLINLLQKNQKKINEKEFFQILIETLFEKNQMQAYFFALIQSFKALINCKSGNQLVKILQPLDWNFAVNIEFYLSSKSRVNKYNFSEKEKQQNKKMYLQLLQQLKEETQSQSQHRKQSLNKQKNNKKKSKADSKRIQQYQSKFFQMLHETLKSIEEVFKLKYARLNKKYAKTKKAMYQVFDTPLVPNLSSFLSQTFQRQEKNNSGRNIRQSQEEIQI